MQEFQLMLDKMKYDCSAYMVWRSKCLDRESARYFQLLAYKADRFKKANEAAASLFNPAHQNQKLTVAIAGDSLAITQLIEDERRVISAKHGLQSARDVVWSLAA